MTRAQIHKYCLKIYPKMCHKIVVVVVVVVVVWSFSSSLFAHKTPLKRARWDTREQNAQGTYCK